MAFATASTTTAAAMSASPMVHAIGGSIGSALALLLFYPLERARIELQSQAFLVLKQDDDYSFLERQQDQQHLVENSERGIDNMVDDTSSNSVVLVDHSRLSTPSSADGNDEENDESASSCMSLQDQQQQQELPRTSLGPEITPTSVVLVGTTKTPNDTTQLQLLQQKRRQRLMSFLSQRSKLVKILLELHKRGELYKGMAPIISTIFTSQFIFFFLHAYAKRLLLPLLSARGKDSTVTTAPPSALLSLISSCLAGVGNVLLTNPLWVTNMAIVTGETKTQNLVRELVQLSKSHGIQHLWDGTSASILLVSNPIIQFFCYEQFKLARLKRAAASAVGGSSISLGLIEAFLIAALAKGIATVSTYPLQLAQTLLRLGSSNNDNNNVCIDDDNTDDSSALHHHHHHHRNRHPLPHHHPKQYKGTVDCLLKLYRTNKSFAAWYTGMRAKLLQTVLTAAFTFLTYEQILKVVQTVTVMRRRTTTIPQ
jgi:solute carrier family 25 (peroxisomal adenine nucleotide transporter), member 17